MGKSRHASLSWPGQKFFRLRLAHAYQAALAAHDITVAQVLLTLEDTEERRRHLNARATLNALLALDAVPVVNENDTVATAEIRFGDNDRLAARVALLGVVDLERGKDLIFSTRGIDHRLDYDDVLVVIGAGRELDAFRELINHKTPPPND